MLKATLVYGFASLFPGGYLLKHCDTLCRRGLEKRGFLFYFVFYIVTKANNIAAMTSTQEEEGESMIKGYKAYR